jgi:hypothetical protein
VKETYVWARLLQLPSEAGGNVKGAITDSSKDVVPISLPSIAPMKVM